MITYEGKRSADGCTVTRSVDENEPQELPLRLDLWNHSSTGFEWGYGGSGPAQLALALLADAVGDDEQAVSLHQKFKWEVVCRLPRDEWQLTDEDIKAKTSRLSAALRTFLSGAEDAVGEAD